jgi:hypothetical protein
MVAAGSLSLLFLSVSSYHCQHGSSSVQRHATLLFGATSSSSSSGPRREDHIKSCLLSAPSVESEGQIDDGMNMNILKLNANQRLWETKYALLKRFQERVGHCNVPHSHKEDGAPLGVWVMTQRRFKRIEKLDPARQKRLEGIGFEWILMKRRAHAPWEEIFSLLKQFQKREGHCSVCQSHTEDGINLGMWVQDQRQLKKQEMLDSEREMCLEEIGFEWAILVPWEEMLSLLKQFTEREGHCRVPRSHAEDGIKLGNWLNRQRQLKTTEKLTPDRERRLEEVGSVSWR